MKIRFIQPSQLDADGKPIRFKKLFFPGLTLPTLAGLTPRGVDVGITTEYVEDIDFDEDVDLVAITAQTCQAPRAYQVAAEFRKRGRKTILGGIHASMCSEEAMLHADSILLGEAEDVWQQIVADARANDLRRVYAPEKKPDLSRLVIPRYDLLKTEHYVIPPWARTSLLSIQATRGCPYNCDFCSVARFLGHEIRKKPVAHVIKEIEALRPSRIFFSDDNIGADPAYARELFGALKPLKMRWACQMSTTILQHPDLINAAAEAGCHETFIGMESLDAENLKHIHKSFNKVDNYAKLLKRMKDVGILAQVAIMIGLDEDTPESLRRSIDIVMDLDVNYLYLAVLTPLPGTPLRDRLAKQGRIIGKDWSAYDFTHVVVAPNRMSASELDGMIWELYEKFYSFRGIAGRVLRFGKQYLRFFPRDNAVEEVFFQIQQRSAILQKTFPFTLGLSGNS